MAMLSQHIEPLKTPEITQERLKYFLHYSPDTGVFTWNINYFNMKKGDRLTSTINAGTSWAKTYNRVKLDKRTYKLSRLAFLYMTGKFPENLVDHINGNSLDDRWCNLREATYSENAINRKYPDNTKTGIVGLCKLGKRYYIAYVTFNYKKFQKTFPQTEEGKAKAIKWLKETRLAIGINQEFIRSPSD